MKRPGRASAHVRAATTALALAATTVLPDGGWAAPGWRLTGSMSEGRVNHTATLLMDGRVLVVGSNFTDAAEVYDPQTGTWSAAGRLSQIRCCHTATLLPTGEVVVLGGSGPAEIYEPRTNTWRVAGGLIQERGEPTATLLDSGKVLVVGGWVYAALGPTGPTASAELYDPATGMSAPTGALSVKRWMHVAVRLRSGKVLVAAGNPGGYELYKSAELYDPATGGFSLTGSLMEGRPLNGRAQVVLLASGEVLLPGSASEARSEIYDPDRGVWTPAPAMPLANNLGYTATLLPSGQVLVAGGGKTTFTAASSLLFDPVQKRWSTAGTLNVPRGTHAAVLLRNGTVLVSGGGTTLPEQPREGTSTAELFEPPPPPDAGATTDGSTLADGPGADAPGGDVGPASDGPSGDAAAVDPPTGDAAVPDGAGARDARAENDGGGCGCRVAATSRPRIWVLALLLLVALVRRRCSRPPTPVRRS